MMAKKRSAASDRWAVVLRPWFHPTSRLALFRTYPLLAGLVLGLFAHQAFLVISAVVLGLLVIEYLLVQSAERRLDAEEDAMWDEEPEDRPRPRPRPRSRNSRPSLRTPLLVFLLGVVILGGLHTYLINNDAEYWIAFNFGFINDIGLPAATTVYLIIVIVPAVLALLTYLFSAGHHSSYRESRQQRERRRTNTASRSSNGTKPKRSKPRSVPDDEF